MTPSTTAAAAAAADADAEGADGAQQQPQQPQQPQPEQHMPLLDYISYADLDAVREMPDANVFGQAGLDEFGILRVPMAYAVESAMNNYEDCFEQRVAILVHMAQRYGASRPFMDPVCGREDTVLRRAFRQVIVYPEDKFNGLTSTQLEANCFYTGHEDDDDDRLLQHVELAAADANEAHEAAGGGGGGGGTAPTPTAAASADPSDIPLVLRVVHALIHEAGASVMEPRNVVESAVHHGLHELLPMLFARGAVFQREGGMLCLHLLLCDMSVPDARVLATLKCLAAYKAVEQRGLDVNVAQTRNRNTPLHAAERGLRGGAVVAQLLRMGADPFAKNLLGHTAVDMVRAMIKHCLLDVRPALRCKHVGCSCGECLERAEQRNTRRLARAISAEHAHVRAIRLRECELACAMAAHPRLGAASVGLRWLDPLLLREIVRAGCQV